MTDQEIMNMFVDETKRIIELKGRLREVEAERDAFREALENILNTDPDEGTAWFHRVAQQVLAK